MTPLDFLRLLWQHKPEGFYILIWMLQGKQSYWFRSISQAAEFLQANGTDVYIGVGAAQHDYGRDRRCPSDEIAGITGLWADLDLRSDAHPKDTLPGSVEQALSILPPEFPPSITILTGNGVHVWWLFREPWIFQNDEDRKEGAALAKRWNTMVSDNGRMKGWKIERLGDLARVLRIPGTTNCKDRAHPKPVTIRSYTDRRYNPSELGEFLDDLGVPDEDAEECVRKQWGQRFQGKPLVIDLRAEIPEAQIAKWTESDPRFKNTWFRHRSDLPDQSQSGYDLALANFGFRVGLTEQQIIDLLVQHRRIHKQKSRNKLDYFYRTLSKAAKHCETTFLSASSSEPAPFAGTMDAEAGSAAQNLRPGQQPKSDRERIDLYKNISDALGVELLRLVKVTGDEPLFRMDLAEGSISFSSVAKFISQAAVRTAIAGRVGRLIPPFKQTQWRTLAQMMLDACIVEDGGEELESQGAARLLIGQYLAEVAFIPCIEGQSPQDRRKPIVRDDQIAVCASDLQLYINKTRSQSISVQAVVAMLSAVGAKVERVRGKTFKEQSRWILPLEHFDPADYASDAPGGPPQHG
jgi:hypothetical protein